MNKPNKKKYFRSIILFVGLIIIAFYFLLRGQDLGELYETIKSANLKFVILGIICMGCYSLGEAINIVNAFRILGKRVSLIQGIKYALVGFFFSGITPSASGGQPMQVYYMYKDGINISSSTMALLIEFSSFQIVVITYALIGFIYCFDFIKASNLGILFFLGIILNLIILFGVLVCMFSKKISRKLIDFILWFLKKIKYKKITKLADSMNEGLDNYQKSAQLIKKNKLQMAKVLLVTFTRITLFNMIPYFVYRSFNLSEYSVFNFIFLQAVLYSTVSSLPLPGAVGISEGCFVTLFKKFIPATLISGAMLLNRGINFYLFILFSGIMVMIATIRMKKKEIIENTC